RPESPSVPDGSARTGTAGTRARAAPARRSPTAPPSPPPRRDPGRPPPPPARLPPPTGPGGGRPIPPLRGARPPRRPNPTEWQHRRAPHAFMRRHFFIVTVVPFPTADVTSKSSIKRRAPGRPRPRPPEVE